MLGCDEPDPEDEGLEGDDDGLEGAEGGVGMLGVGICTDVLAQAASNRLQLLASSGRTMG